MKPPSPVTSPSYSKQDRKSYQRLLQRKLEVTDLPTTLLEQEFECFRLWIVTSCGSHTHTHTRLFSISISNYNLNNSSLQQQPQFLLYQQPAYYCSRLSISIAIAYLLPLIHIQCTIPNWTTPVQTGIRTLSRVCLSGIAGSPRWKSGRSALSLIMITIRTLTLVGHKKLCCCTWHSEVLVVLYNASAQGR